MNVTDAAKRLANALRGAVWLISVGVGQDGGKDAVFLYVSRTPPKKVAELSALADNFPIIVRKTGPLRPLSSR